VSGGRFRRIASLAFVAWYVLWGGVMITQALTQQQVYQLGIDYYDVSDSDCDTGTVAATPTVSGAGEGFTIDQVKTFASEPVTSTWNISDSAVEQWFLKQSGARATIQKYGLNSDNIGDITAAVKAGNVSPVFFYLYTVNEGGGAGGFINHYGSDIAGGGIANAQRDAQYLTDQSQQTGSPATGGGEPADMPFAEAKQILDALPKGSIGTVYIQATAAVTAELEDLSGKTGDWSGKYNMPLSDLMLNIKRMGGDPQQGGATISADGCTGSVTGEGMTKGINFALAIANNNGYGYDQDTRESGWQKWNSDPSCTTRCGSFDCSSFVSAILTVAGYFPTNPNFATGNEASMLTGAGFKEIASSAPTSTGLLPGDVLVADGHTALYIGNDQMVEARINENGGISGGQVGDQNGKEIRVSPFSDHPWIGVYRAQN
jgi:cell wall-associated NlpC family hydrolase